MLSDAGDVAKVRNAFEKLDDAEEKFCDVRLSAHTGAAERDIMIAAIEGLAAAKMAVSEILPETKP